VTDVSGARDLLRQDVAMGIPVRPGTAERGLRSHDGAPAQFELINRTSSPIDLHWIDFSGRRQNAGSVSPGHSFFSNTFDSHPFVACAPNGSTLGVLVARAGRCCAAIGAPLVEGGKTRVLVSRAPESEAKLRSTSSNRRSQLQLTNAASEPVDIHWIDFQGQRRHSGWVEPGATYHSNSFESHPFVATDPHGSVLGIFVARAGRCVGTIEPRSKDAFGLCTTIEGANASFFSQWGPTHWNSAEAPYGYQECAPTSELMALVALGILGRPEPSEAADTIHNLRTSWRARDPGSDDTQYEEVVLGIARSGGAAKSFEPSLESIDSALRRRHAIILSGDAGSAWGPRLDQRGEFLVHYAARREAVNHSVLVLGKVGDDYIVSDPLSRIGAILASTAEIQAFMAGGTYRGNQGRAAIEIWRP
jgi:hypothetical protein